MNGWVDGYRVGEPNILTYSLPQAKNLVSKYRYAMNVDSALLGNEMIVQFVLNHFKSETASAKIQLFVFVSLLILCVQACYFKDADECFHIYLSTYYTQTHRHTQTQTHTHTHTQRHRHTQTQTHTDTQTQTHKRTHIHTHTSVILYMSHLVIVSLDLKFVFLTMPTTSLVNYSKKIFVFFHLLFCFVFLHAGFEQMPKVKASL